VIILFGAVYGVFGMYTIMRNICSKRVVW
jgi:hypothetical protein